MEGQFLVVPEVGLEELFEGGLGELGLEGDETLLAGMIDHQFSVVGLEGGYLLQEVGVAGEVDLVELVLVYEVDGHLLQVLVGSAVLPCPVCEQQRAFLRGQPADALQFFCLLDLPDGLLPEVLDDLGGLHAGELSGEGSTVSMAL